MPRGRPKGSKNRPKLSAYNKQKVKLAREKMLEMQCPLFDKLPDADVAQFVILKENNVYIRWDFTRGYLNDIVEKITKLLTGNSS
jgi:hypothetical protein